MHGASTLRAPAWCPPGRERELIDLLAELDEYNDVTIDELLHTLPHYTGRVETGLRRLSWRARQLLAPTLLEGRTPSMILLTQVDLTTYTSRQLLSISVDTVDGCVLVSSLREDGSHTPALDLDYPAGLYQDRHGGHWLNLHPASPAIEYHGTCAIDWADRAMAAIGLTRVSGRPPGPLVDLTPYGQVANALGNTWTECFENLWHVTATLETPTRADPKNTGVWYQVDGQALLVPSTSWWHLYLDRPIDQDTYLRAVDALAACGLLNPGFANGSRDRGFTSLRRPGLKKIPPFRWDPVDPDAIPF
jgi:hypothetical protein